MLTLVNDKCIPADLPEIHISRTELMKKLKIAALGLYIYIGAPAGSGKTVTALLWNSICGRKPLWISLDAYDNAPSVFYRQLSAVLCSTQPKNKNMLSILEDTAFSSSPVENTIRIIAEMQLDDKNLYTLTLDDLHLISNMDILNSLPAVLKRLPRSFIVLFLSRNAPPESFFNTKTGILKQENSVINMEHLRFSEKELKSYFLKLGRVITEEETALVLMVTEGLAIGINAIAKSKKIESGNTEYEFANYIREHLWESWDSDLRDFMLKTSIVSEINEKLAVTLTGLKNAEKTLQNLCAANIFISHVGKDMYRYHHLFLAFLRDMAKESKINLAGLNKAAAKYYLDARQYLLARHYAVQSGNDNMIFKVIHQFNQYTNPAFDEYEAFSRLFNRSILDKGICDSHPYLYTSMMEAAWISGDREAVELYWDKLRHYLPVIAVKYPKILETVILELAADYRKPFPQLVDEFNNMPPIPRLDKHYQVSTFSLQLPFIHRSLRDFSDLSEYADKGMMEKLDKSFGLLLKDMYKTIMSSFFSAILLERNKIEEALKLAIQANEEAAKVKNPEAIFTAYNHLSAVYFAMGNEVLLRETLAKTENYIAQSGARFLDRNFLAWKTKIKLMDADKHAAEEWLDNYFVNDDDDSKQSSTVPLYKIFQCFTTVRALIILNRGSRAMALINRIIQFARDYRRPMDLAEALTLKACMEWASGRRAEAAGILEEALLPMQEKRFIRIIADEGAAVVPILKRIASSLGESPAALDRTYITEVILAASEVANRCCGILAFFKKSGKPVKLSKQQTKMLELLAKGYKNAEIAKMTNVSVATVKWHLMHAYEKLDVNNSIDALLKAKSLGLLK
ncbi:MAG: LuxR C-terminal-related transcriptional regulator [Treponema sp.]|nr:LuxR C-terminal-related transcriptional regulator [Treponema sp.]